MLPVPPVSIPPTSNTATDVEPRITGPGEDREDLRLTVVVQKVQDAPFHRGCDCGSGHWGSNRGTNTSLVWTVAQWWYWS